MALTKVTGSGANGLTLSSTDITVSSGDLLFATANKGVCLGVTSNTDSNTLEDYEEGTYTATVTCSTSGTVTLNSSNNTGSYRKIGSLVQVQGDFSVSGVSSPSGYAQVSLPFAVVAESQDADRASQAIMVHGSTSNVRDFVAATFGGESVVRIFLGDGTTVASDSANAMQTNTEIYINAIYHTA